MKIGATLFESEVLTERGLNGALEAYLEQLDRPLNGLVDERERSSFVDQTRFHLEQSILDRLERGESLEIATEQVLSQFGAASENSNEFIESWFEYRIRTPLSRKLGHSNLIAYGFFQAAVLVYYLILQINVFLPSEAIYRIPWRLSPLQIREVWPEPLPFPDFTFGFFLTIGWPIVAPLVAGALVGAMVPARPAAAVYRGLMPLILLSFVMGALLLPMTQGILFALFQVVFWLPAGSLCAIASSAWIRRRRIQAHHATPNMAKESR